jgi:hypothetical protein
VFCAQSLEHPQTFTFLFTKSKSQIIAIVAFAKLPIKLVLAGNHLVNSPQIPTPNRTQLVRNFLGNRDLGPDQPERVDEWALTKFPPFLAERNQGFVIPSRRQGAGSSRVRKANYEAN